MRFFYALKAFWFVLKNPKIAKGLFNPSENSKDLSYLQLLTLLQKKGRLIDFLKEDISLFSNEEVGLASRKIHTDLKKALEETIKISPLYSQKEGSKVTVEENYSAAQVQIVGKVKGKPPYDGTLQHAGWKVEQVSFPKSTTLDASFVIQPAEIEVREE